MNLLITGGSGYVGTRLIFKLIEKNINIHNYDVSLFGDEHLPIKENFYYHKKDLRDTDSFRDVISNHKIDIVLHLACISNDPTFELNSKISKEINYDAFEPIVKISKELGVKKFIYASTCSVYGVSEKKDVTEEHPLLPITDYNKFKALCEPVLKNYIDENFHGIIIRPATVCGYSEKMRFDLSVNILTNFAYNKGYIKVFGGNQLRPNCHIDDMCDLYERLIFEDFGHLNGEIFNVGSEKTNRIGRIFKLISSITKFKGKLKVETKRVRPSKSEVVKLHSSSKKFKLLFKWKTKTNLREGLKKTIDWYIKNQKLFQKDYNKYSI